MLLSNLKHRERKKQLKLSLAGSMFILDALSACIDHSII